METENSKPEDIKPIDYSQLEEVKSEEPEEIKPIDYSQLEEIVPQKEKPANTVKFDVFDSDKKNKELGDYAYSLKDPIEQMSLANKFASGQLVNSLTTYTGMSQKDSEKIAKLSKDGNVPFDSIVKQDGDTKDKLLAIGQTKEITAKNPDGSFKYPATIAFLSTPTNAVKNRDNYKNLLEAEQVLDRSKLLSLSNFFSVIKEGTTSLLSSGYEAKESLYNIIAGPTTYLEDQGEEEDIKNKMGDTLDLYSDTSKPTEENTTNIVNDLVASANNRDPKNAVLTSNEKIDPKKAVLRADPTMLKLYMKNEREYAEDNGKEYHDTPEQAEKNFLAWDKMEKQSTDSLRQAFKPIPDEYTKGFHKVINDVIGFAPQVVATTALSTIDPMYGAAFLWQMMYGDTVAKHKEAGRSEGDSAISGILDATAQMPLAYLKLDKLMKMFKSTGMTNVLKNMGEAVLSSGTQGVGQKVIESVFDVPLDKEATSGKEAFSNWVDKLPDTLKKGAYQGVLMSVFAVMGGMVVLPKEIKASVERSKNKQYFRMFDNINKFVKSKKNKSEDIPSDFIDTTLKNKGLPTDVHIKYSDLAHILGSKRKANKALDKMGVFDELKNNEGTKVELNRTSQLIYDEVHNNAAIKINLMKFSKEYAGTDEGVLLRNKMRWSEHGLSSEESAYEQSQIIQKNKEENLAEEAKNNILNHYQKTDVGRTIFRQIDTETVAEKVAGKDPLWTPEYAQEQKDKAGLGGEDSNNLYVQGSNIETQSKSMEDVITISKSDNITTASEERVELYLEKAYKTDKQGNFVDEEMNDMVNDMRNRMKIQNDYETDENNLEFTSTIAIDYLFSENPETFWGKSSFTKGLKKILDQLGEYIHRLIKNAGIYKKARETGAISDEMHTRIHDAVKGDFEALQKSKEFTTAEADLKVVQDKIEDSKIPEVKKDDFNYQIQSTHEQVSDFINSYTKLTKLQQTFGAFNSKERQNETQNAINATLYIISRITGLELPKEIGKNISKEDANKYIIEAKNRVKEVIKGNKFLPDTVTTNRQLEGFLDVLKNQFKDLNESGKKEKRDEQYRKQREEREYHRPVIEFVKEMGGLKTKPKGYIGGEYDGMPNRRDVRGRAKDLFQGKDRGMHPDELAAHLYDEGLIEDAYVDTMYEAIKGEVGQEERKEDNTTLRPDQQAEMKALEQKERTEKKESEDIAKKERKKERTEKKEIKDTEKNKRQNERDIKRVLTNVTTLSNHIYRLIKTIPKPYQGEALAKLTDVANVYKKNSNVNSYIENSIKEFDDIIQKSKADQMLQSMDVLLKQYRDKKDLRGRKLSRNLTAEETKVISKALEYLNYTRPQVKIRIEELESSLDKGVNGLEITKEQHEINTLNEINLLRTFGGIRQKTAPEIRNAYNQLTAIIEKGLKNRNEIDNKQRIKIEKGINEAIKTITGSEELISGETGDKIKMKHDDWWWNLADGVNNFIEKSLLGWEYTLNALARKEKDKEHLQSSLNKYAISAQKAIGQRKNEVYAKTRGIHNKLAEIYEVSNQFKLNNIIRKVSKRFDDVLHVRDVKHKEVVINVDKAEKILDDRDTKTGFLYYEGKKLSRNMDELLTQKVASKKYFQDKQGRDNVISDFKIEVIKSESKKENKSVSQFEAIQYALMAEQEKMRGNMLHNGWDDKSIHQLYSFLTPESIKIKEYLQKEYENGYHSINEVYKKINHTDMSRIKSYAPPKFQYNEGNMKLDLQKMTGGGSLKGLRGSSSNSTSTIERIDHNRDFEKVSAIDMFSMYIAESSHYKAFAEFERDVKGVFFSEKVINAIKQEFGYRRLANVTKQINDLVNGGINNEMVDKLADQLRAGITRYTLSLKPIMFLKQASSHPAYAMGMPAIDYFKYTKEFLDNPIENWKKIYNLPFIQERLHEGFSTDMQNALKSTIGKPPSYVSDLFNFGMLPIRYGDIVPIVPGYYAKYRSYYERNKTDNMSDKEVLQLKEDSATQAEMLTVRFQQSGDHNQLPIYGMMGSWLKLGQVYISSDRGFDAGLLESGKDALAGKPEAKKMFAKQVITNIILANAYQAVGDSAAYLLSGGDNTPDWEDYLIASTLFPIKGIWLVRNVVESLARRLLKIKGNKLSFTQVEDFLQSLLDAGYDLTQLDFQKALYSVEKSSGLYQTLKPFIKKKKKTTVKLKR